MYFLGQKGRKRRKEIEKEKERKGGERRGQGKKAQKGEGWERGTDSRERLMKK